MKRVDRIVELRAVLARWRGRGRRLALVPTMGNLHPGHLALVAEARRHADRVAVSIFVNPTQFAPGEDYREYPRTPEDDLPALEAAGCDLVFTPPVTEIYPDGLDAVTTVSVPGVSRGLCGEARPGHFDGVASVVTRLFNLFRPDVAVFGEKDYQQLLVIRRLVRDLHFDIDVIGFPTERDEHGLALSSRNRYLSADQKRTAAVLYRTLCWVRDRLGAGATLDGGLADEAARRLTAGGLEPEYVAIRRAEDLAPPAADDRRLIVLAAARLGPARLIDNVRVERPDLRRNESTKGDLW